MIFNIVFYISQINEQVYVDKAVAPVLILLTKTKPTKNMRIEILNLQQCIENKNISVRDFK